MTSFNEEFKREAEAIRLTERERAGLRARILGVPEAAPVRTPYAFSFSYFSYSRMAAAAISLALVVGGAGGTLYAAEGALPGDFLYPVKTGVAEPLSGAFALGADAEAAWHEELAAKRLAEAEALAVRGRLTDTVGAELAASFQKHAAEADTQHGSGYGKSESQADARERLRALVAAKGASILEASGRDEEPARRAAIASFVLSVLDDEGTSKPAVFVQGRAAKETADAQAPTAVMMTMSGALPDANAKRAPGTDLPALASSAKQSFEDARQAMGERGSPYARAQLSAAFRTLVKADAEAMAGADEDARAHYEEVIEKARALGALWKADIRIDDDEPGGEEGHDEKERERGADDDWTRGLFNR